MTKVERRKQQGANMENKNSRVQTWGIRGSPCLGVVIRGSIFKDRTVS